MPRRTYDRAVRHLARNDTVLRNIIDRVGPCTLRASDNQFLTLVEAVIWQQLSWQAAQKIHRKVINAVGTESPAPQDFLRCPRESLREAGLSRMKVEYVLGICAGIQAKMFDLAQLKELTNDAVIDRLMGFKGIGRWTAEMFLIFGLNRLDVFPAGDLGLRKAIARHYGIDGIPSSRRVEEITRIWKPYRTVGAWYLWQSSDALPLS